MNSGKPKDITLTRWLFRPNDGACRKGGRQQWN
jgi:hypothetical protein